MSVVVASEPIRDSVALTGRSGYGVSAIRRR